MSREYVVVPYLKELTNEDNWSNEEDKKTFSCVRYHFELRFRQVDEPSKIGETIAVYDGLPGTVIKAGKSCTTTKELIKINETIEEAITQNQTLVQITGIITNKINFLLNDNKAELKTKVQHEINHSFRTHLRVLNAIREQETVVYKANATMAISENDGPIALVAVYQKQAIDVFLCLVDYLIINYKRPFFGIRKKKHTYPPAPFNQFEHKNFILYNKPVVTIEYWKLLPESCRLIRESDHKIQVIDSDEFYILPPQTSKFSYLEKPIKPTLYQISNKLFPLKWIKRKTQYTEKELIEMEKRSI